MIPGLAEEIKAQNLKTSAMDSEDARICTMLGRTDAILTAEELPVLEKGQSCRIKVGTIPSGAPLPEIQVKIDNPAVAAGNGLQLEALARGATKVHLFSVGNAIPFASLALVVEEHNYASVMKIQVPPLALGEGHEIQLSLQTVPPDAEDRKSCVWSSSDTRVAKVDAKGIVKGISGGDVRITAKGARTEDSITLQVKPRIQRIAISSREMSLYVGDRRAVGIDIQPRDCYDDSWQWSSTDSSVAVLSEDKNYPEIVANGIGKCIITVRAEGGAVLDNCSVTVESTFYRKENKHTALSASLVFTILAVIAMAAWAPAGAVVSLLSVVFAVKAIKRNPKDKGYGILFIVISVILFVPAMMQILGGY